MEGRSKAHPNTAARDHALQFLYQSEAEKLFHFSRAHFETFISGRQISDREAPRIEALVAGALDQLAEIDQQIEESAENWRLERMGAIDRNILRLATFELLARKTPPKVVLDEAIELAKRYGTAESGSFVNGILDRMMSLFAGNRDESK